MVISNIKKYLFDGHPVSDKQWFADNPHRKVRVRWALGGEFPFKSMLVVVIYLGPEVRLRLPLNYYDVGKLATAHKRNPTFCSTLMAAYLYSEIPEEFDEVAKELAALS